MTTVAVFASSCDKYKDFWPRWTASLEQFWPSCLCSKWIQSNDITGSGLVPTGPDIGWNRNILKAITAIQADYILLTLENHILLSSVDEISFDKAHGILDTNSSIGLVQLSRCWPTETRYEHWNKLGYYNRTPHPFKICSLSATPLWRKSLLIAIINHVISEIPEQQDVGRQGAVEFEVEGTRLWVQNNSIYPWNVLGIDRDAGQTHIYPFGNESGG